MYMLMSLHTVKGKVMPSMNFFLTPAPGSPSAGFCRPIAEMLATSAACRPSIRTCVGVHARA